MPMTMTTRNRSRTFFARISSHWKKRKNESYADIAQKRNAKERWPSSVIDRVAGEAAVD
jgi:hypothetical protein